VSVVALAGRPRTGRNGCYGSAKGPGSRAQKGSGRQARDNRIGEHRGVPRACESVEGVERSKRTSGPGPDTAYLVPRLEAHRARFGRPPQLVGGSQRGLVSEGGACDILHSFPWRCSVEMTSAEMCRHLGVETQRPWSTNRGGPTLTHSPPESGDV